MVLSGYSGFLHLSNWSPWYSWNIDESGVKLQKFKYKCVYMAHADVLNQENYPCPITINIEMTLLLTMLWKLFIQCFPSGLPVIERKWNKHQTWFNNVHVWDLLVLVIVHVIWVLLNDWIRLKLEVLFVYLHCMMLCCIPSITMEWNCASIKICINFCSWVTFN